MNVQELIDVLENIEDKTKNVITEGCDCTSDIGSVTLCGDEVSIDRPITKATQFRKKIWKDKFSDEELEKLP